MWKGTPGLSSLMRRLDRRNPKPKEVSPPASDSQIPDLSANNDNLHEITMARDAVRGLRS